LTAIIEKQWLGWRRGQVDLVVLGGGKLLLGATRVALDQSADDAGWKQLGFTAISRVANVVTLEELGTFWRPLELVEIRRPPRTVG